MERTRVDLGPMAKAVLDELRQQDPGRQVAIAIQDGLQAWGDSHLLRIVLDNLLGNAWKFTGRKSNATVEFDLIHSAGRWRLVTLSAFPYTSCLSIHEPVDQTLGWP